MPEAATALELASRVTELIRQALDAPHPVQAVPAEVAAVPGLVELLAAVSDIRHVATAMAEGDLSWRLRRTGGTAGGGFVATWFDSSMTLGETYPEPAVVAS